MRGQAPMKKKEEAADEGDEGKEQEDEDDPEIVLLGKKQAKVASVKAEAARMTAAGTGMGRHRRQRCWRGKTPCPETVARQRPDQGRAASLAAAAAAAPAPASAAAAVTTRRTSQASWQRPKVHFATSNQRKWPRGRRNTRTFTLRPHGGPHVCCLPRQPAKRSMSAACPPVKSPNPLGVPAGVPQQPRATGTPLQGVL